MKIFATAFCLLILAGPVLAETPAGKFQRCIEPGSALDTSEECVALRATYRAQIDGCMTASRVASADRIKIAPSGSNHAYRARYLICTRTAKSSHGPFGH